MSLHASLLLLSAQQAHSFYGDDADGDETSCLGDWEGQCSLLNLTGRPDSTSGGLVVTIRTYEFDRDGTAFLCRANFRSGSQIEEGINATSKIHSAVVAADILSRCYCLVKCHEHFWVDDLFTAFLGW